MENFTAAEECFARIHIRTVTHYCLIPSFIIITILAILHGRRVKCGPFGWRPGMPVPLDFLDGYKHRWAYASAFGSTSNRILYLLIKSDQYWGTGEEVPEWIKKTLLVLVAILETSVVFYPIFACLTTRYKVAGASLGASYSVAWFIVQMIFMLECPNSEYGDSFLTIEGVPYTKLIYQWPTAAFFLALVLYFLGMLWKCYKTGDYVEKEKQSVAAQHHIVYVKALLKGHLPKNIKNTYEESMLESFKYSRVPGFQYPSKFWSEMFVSLSIAYQLIIAALVVAGNGSDAINRYLPLITASYGEIVSGVFIILSVSEWISTFLVIVMLTGSLFFIFKNYRRNMLQLFRGDKSFIPSQVTLYPATLMAANMRWTGYQIAYLAWGLFIFYLTVFLILSAVLIFPYVIIYLFGWDGVLGLALWLGPPFLMNLIIFYSQVFCSRGFFLQPKPAEDQPVPLAVDNRKAFETFFYFTFFINIGIGFVSSIIRLLLSLVIGLFTLGRMDQPIIKRGYEWLDKGHGAYIGMLYVDYTHNHPVLRVFCEELRAAVDKSRTTVQEELIYVNAMVTHHKAKPVLGARGKRLWYLAYTLIRNPNLIQYRKHDLERKHQPVDGASRTIPTEDNGVICTQFITLRGNAEPLY